MSLIKIESLFPDDPKPSQGIKNGTVPQEQQVPFLPPHLQQNFELIDLALIKKTHISVNVVYNLMLQKGIVTPQEYAEMKDEVHRHLYPEDFK